MLAPIDVNIDALREHFSLPVLPEVLAKVQEAMRSDYVSIRSVANHLSLDASLVAEVLKIVNSAYYGLPRDIREVEVAIAYLGLREIHHLVLSSSVLDHLVPEEQAAFEHLKFHSILTALWAKHLARRFAPFLRLGELWAAGMLHDLGKFVYLKFYPEHYKTLLRHSQNNGCLFSESEKLFSLIPSARFGVMLSDHWRLPRTVHDVCAMHSLHDLQNKGEGEGAMNTFTGIVTVGNLLASLSHEVLAEGKKDEIADAVMAELDLTSHDFVLLMGPSNELKIWAKRLLS